MDQELIRLAQAAGFARWLEQITATGGCAHPIYLAGVSTTVDRVTGAVLRHYTTSDEPGGRLAVRCRNRRSSRCAPCAWEHQGDTFHLVRAGLLGGKGTPETVQAHPALFVTLTAPGFGPVHRTTTGQPCRPRRGTCPHNIPFGCVARHAEDDPAAGQPLCRECYDYFGHVLWHAHTRDLWDRFTRNLRRHLATAAGLVQSRFAEHARLSFAKVAEYQRRGAVHFHAVIRLDGPDGPATPSPTWATPELLTTAVHDAAASVVVRTPPAAGTGERLLRWGAQLDVRPLRGLDAGAVLRPEAVAGYIAKYTTKSTGDTGGTDRRIDTEAEIRHLRVNDHYRALIGTCWRLDGLLELEHLRLRAWAHMLGYRGHCLTKSRAYSTTYGALRQARADHRRTAAGPALYADWENDTLTDATWRYAGSGHTPAEALLASGIAEDLASSRAIARETPR
ncbi:FAM166 family protein [Streptacidiphilus sp. ASG 303]|nr:FAM166 family protein [Streptacidiphilus sp. ASG 303]